jgi:large subunit ribosomal protein L4
MEIGVITLERGEAGTIELAPAVFEVPVRPDVMHQVVRWQLAKRRQGTHKTKGRSEVKATSKKMYKQKGTGRARHGNAAGTQFRGGGVPFGPRPRDHAHALPRKVRALGLKSALSSKLADGKLVVLDEARLPDHKTKHLAARLADLGWSSVLVMDGDSFETNFSRAAQNLQSIQLLRVDGANVYDILKRDTLVLTRDAVRQLEERLG